MGKLWISESPIRQLAEVTFVTVSPLKNGSESHFLVSVGDNGDTMVTW